MTKSKLDWRYRVSTELAEDAYLDGKLLKKGTPVSLTTFVKYGKREISFGDPSPQALFLSQSYKAYQLAMAIHPFLIQQWPPSGTSDPSMQVYDYLEQIITAITFAYTALETFANQEIPKNYVYEEKLKSGLLIPRDKEWIERYLNLNVKLSIILPEVLGKPMPKGTTLWNRFKNLEKLRNRIIHLKPSDHQHSTAMNMYPKSIWSDLLNPKPQNYPLTAKNLIAHFRGSELENWPF